MRRLGIVLAALILVLPASAASINPKLFVLSSADVPRGYDFDPSNSLLLSKATVDRARNEEGRLLRRAGFQGAYLATYINVAPPRWRFVHSGAYVFRDRAGVQAFLRLGKSAQLPLITPRGHHIDFGDEAWLYRSPAPDDATTIVWRYRNVVAYVSCEEMAGQRAIVLQLARKQQRRIVAAS